MEYVSVCFARNYFAASIFMEILSSMFYRSSFNKEFRMRLG